MGSNNVMNYGGLYNMMGWGEPYFTVNTDGHLCVKADGDETKAGQEMDVLHVIEAAKKNNKGIQFPMILRFPDVLKHRLDSLHAAFHKAISNTGYTNAYQGVFPVKVNQNKAIVHDFVRFGHAYSYGLEAGSKPELLIAISCLLAKAADSRAFLVCNGYKDAEYVRLALSARAMGLNAIIVLDMEEELDIIVDQSSKLGVEPVIGVRAKLLTKIPGHYGSTAGKHGKFGLPADKIYGVAKKLKDLNKLHWLKLLHFHVGSMIPTTELVSKAATEAAGIYCTLVNKYDAEMTTLDCGGGLGVDYDGTRSADSDMSVAYTLEEYASSMVQAVRTTCDKAMVSHPVLCTESGQAMVSHHSMIILEALSAIPEPEDNDDDDETPEQLRAKIQHHYSSSQPTAPMELQKHGIEMYKLAKKLSKRIAGDANTIYNYHMNLSVFSLLPDIWGIKWRFPVMPVSRLDEEPTQMSTLVDLTCDSDGKIDNFIGNADTLPLHPLDPQRGGYYVAVLISGAYQEALSSKHNLFGGPSIVRVEKSTGLGGGGGTSFHIATADLGPTTEDLIGTMRYNVTQDIVSVIERRAIEMGVWEVVHTGLTTMPYLIVQDHHAGSSWKHQGGKAKLRGKGESIVKIAFRQVSRLLCLPFTWSVRSKRIGSAG